jgi:hypothetical protein
MRGAAILLRAACLATLAAGSLVACSRASEDFSGTYAAVTAHDVRPLIRIYRSGDHYMLARAENGQWSGSGVPMESVPRTVFERYVGHPVKGDVSGLNYASATLFRLPRGYTEGKFVSHTGYLLITAAGPVEVQKQ